MRKKKELLSLPSWVMFISVEKFSVVVHWYYHNSDYKMDNL